MGAPSSAGDAESHLPDVEHPLAIVSSSYEHDFGVVLAESRSTHVFSLFNPHDVPLEVREIGVGCSCTIASVSPKYSVSQMVGYIKGKSAIRVVRDFMRRHRNYKGYHFWARGYFVSTVGIDETTIRKCIRNQEENDKKAD